MFVDTHCHIFSEYYDNIPNEIKNWNGKLITKFISNGCDGASNKEVVSLSNKINCYYGAIGIHPEECDNYTDADIEYIKDNIKNKKIVAIGEIGLDYHYDDLSKDKQRELFKKQLEIAEDNDIPVIIHSRDAIQETYDILSNYKVKGVIHSFSGSYEMAERFIRLGFYLGINGVITFKNCNLKETIKRISLDHILLETDSPYLTPVPFRGEKNSPEHINDIALFMSDLYGMSLEEIANITNKNVKRIFDI